MGFDIHRLDESDDPVEEIDEYRDELMELSPPRRKDRRICRFSRAWDSGRVLSFITE
jgi:hypothetical protein